MATSDDPSATWFAYINETPLNGWNYYYLSENPNITWVLNLQKGMVYAMHLTGTISLAIALFHSNWAHLFDFNCGDVFRLPPGW